MRLATIWTLPGLPLRERLTRSREYVWMWLARRLPRRLAYWSFIDSGARAINGDEVVPDVRYVDLLARLDR